MSVREDRVAEASSGSLRFGVLQLEVPGVAGYNMFTSSLVKTSKTASSKKNAKNRFAMRLLSFFDYFQGGLIYHSQPIEVR